MKALRWSLVGCMVLWCGLFVLGPAVAQGNGAQEVGGVFERMESGRVRLLRIEVAENGWLFVPDTEPVHNGDPFLPAYGGEFITSGYLYPAGTLTCGIVDSETGARACDGVNADGTPEFPDKVMGTWTCRGWHVGNGALTETGAWTATNQIYSFTPEITEEYGFRTITTDGFESPENKEVRRVVTGGTGRFAGVQGEQIQKFVGWNPSVGVGLEVRLRLWW